jgi:hypothetical protein
MNPVITGRFPSVVQTAAVPAFQFYVLQIVPQGAFAFL